MYIVLWCGMARYAHLYMIVEEVQTLLFEVRSLLVQMYNFGKKETHLSSICQGPKQNTHYLGMIIFRKHKPI